MPYWSCWVIESPFREQKIVSTATMKSARQVLYPLKSDARHAYTIERLLHSMPILVLAALILSSFALLDHMKRQQGCRSEQQKVENNFKRERARWKRSRSSEHLQYKETQSKLDELM